MVKNRSGQRGVVKLATSLLLGGVGLLASATGCSSETSEQGAGTERVGSRVQGLLCSLKEPCPPSDDCGTWTCDLKLGECVVKPLAADGDKCYNASKELGVCIASQCCTGCYQKTKAGLVCRPGTEVTGCGQPGTECADCSGTDSCTIYTCVPEKLVCDTTPISDGKPCSTGNGICTGGRCCAGCIDSTGACQQGTAVTACGLSNAQNGLVKCRNCDDGNVCNNDSCVNGVCAAPTPKAGTCNDNTVCNGAEVCGNGTCNPGTPLNCDDKNPCTIDSCDPVAGCLHTAVEAGTSCDNDLNKCNGTAKCDGTVCKPIAPVDCDDSNICTTDGCTPATGVCTHVNNTLGCSDNDLCTLVDKCSAGKCVGTGAPNCNDNEACTVDSCDKAKGCVHSAVEDNTACDDGNDCSTGDKCVAGKCSFVMGKNCNDNNPCTVDACAANVCGPTNVDNGTPCVFDRCHVNSECQTGKCTEGDPINCDDGNPCTTDTCDAATGCKHTNVDGGDCSDNDACTVSDKCSAGKCVGTEMKCSAIDDCHTEGTCNPKTGACDDPRAPDETVCKTPKGADGLCDTGVCVESEGTGGAGPGTGGQPGAGGDTTSSGGSAVAQGGEPATGSGAEGNQPTASAGETGEPGKAGSPGTEPGGGDAGSPEVPENVFVRQPGGCSCHVPRSAGSRDWAWAAGAALAVALASLRRRAREGKRAA